MLELNVKHEFPDVLASLVSGQLNCSVSISVALMNWCCNVPFAVVIGTSGLA